MMFLSWVLMWFEAISGLRINLDKSAPHRSVTVWDGVEERLRKKLARKVKLRIEQIQRDFLWGGGALEQKPYLVWWGLVCLDKSKGVIKGKFGEEQGGWCSKEVRGGFSVGLWKAIRREWIVVSGMLSFELSSRMLRSKMCGVPLWEGGSWSLYFSRPFNDCELDEDYGGKPAGQTKRKLGWLRLGPAHFPQNRGPGPALARNRCLNCQKLKPTWSYFAVLAGCFLSYTVVGHEGPAVLLVHGFGAFFEHYRDNIHPVADSGKRVWAITLLGFGKSEKPNVFYSELMWAELLRDFIIQVVGEPVHLVGNSIGGYFISIVAGLWPALAKSVILINSAGNVIPGYSSVPSSKALSPVGRGQVKGPT
ncbi:hypothetical protein CK203_085832 [Vitis vinifera]|uniref:AB hydrolase-1 domain-containing protein n=1 Tax=Vitis vinifera TaxID=29760 RepID=A0A438DIE8_VITVI|nr:hypothetical protein CK203_085832 [Vitis vinifera]